MWDMEVVIMSDKNDCPCEAVKRLEAIVERHDKRLDDGNVQFAVISTKLNIIMAVMSAVGVALAGAIVALVFKAA